MGSACFAVLNITSEHTNGVSSAEFQNSIRDFPCYCHTTSLLRLSEIPKGLHVVEKEREREREPSKTEPPEECLNAAYSPGCLKTSSGV